MKVKKVLLITPPAISVKAYDEINPLPPLGLGYMAAMLEGEGIEVKIIDSLIEGWHQRVALDDNIVRIGLTFEQIENIIRSFKPDMVGISNLFSKQRKNAHQIAAIAKKIDKGIITIMGGAHPTACPELVLQDDNIDYVVLGEGERTILDLINFIEGRKSFDILDGVGLKINNHMTVTPKTKFIMDLDNIPFPAWHLLNLEKYFGLKASHGMRKKKRFSPIVTSRGCPAKCVFCSAHMVWGCKFRKRSPENVLEEMKLLKKLYGIEEILFEDDNTTLDVRRASKIFDLMIQEKLNFVWDTPNGIAAFALNKPLIKKMAEAGCYRLNLALESGNQDNLRNNIKKPLKLESIPPLTEYAKDLGLEVGIFFVMGIPGETEEMMWDSLRLADKLGIYDPFISIATPYPGTELYNICIEKGYLKEGFTFDDLFIRSFSISTPDWDRDKLQKIYKAGKGWLRKKHFRKYPWGFLTKYGKKFIAYNHHLFSR